MSAALPRRLALRIRGQVQGVGFRPFVWRLAHDCGLSGWVRNDGEGVALEVQGSPAALADFRAGLERPPALARIEAIAVAERAPDPAAAAGAFAILPSGGGPARTGLAPDAAVCADCLAELCDPAARRWRYAFTTCSHCGPRYTIAARLPWDRANTSLAAFPPCADCAAEYADPADRRFHAQPLACPACGPRLRMLAPDGTPLAGADPVAATLALIRAGRIVAVKGLGGFHLLCDARHAAAVAELRARKRRPAKPFALLAANLASLAAVVRVNPDTAALLTAPERPVVLLDAVAGLSSLAPGLDRYGAMLPATPLQYLLFHEAAGRPAGTGWLAAPQALLLVCTSANPHGEPLMTDDDEAVARLGGIADAILGHDRAILRRCDDSVLLPRAGVPVLVRRARGWTPRAIRLPGAGPSVLAIGGDLKNAVCATRGDEAYLAPHLGDLGSAAARRALADDVARLLDLLAIAPERVACDRHPDTATGRCAAAFAAEHGLPLIAVQHHHAHIAAVAAEHGIAGPLLGLALDGFGLGSDGRPWGGELLRVDGAGCERLGHFAPLALPGGDAAAREPWRMAAAALHVLGRGAEIAGRFAAYPAARTVAALLARGAHGLPGSSAGRLFDAAAGLLGVCATMSYEGEAAMRLEAAARRHGPVQALAGGWQVQAGGLDFAALLARLADERDAGHGAALFHATLAAGLADWVLAAVRETGLRTVTAAGGVCLNRVLLDALRARLDLAGLVLLEAQQAPPNDGGLALGQAWVAMQAPART